MLPQPLSVSTFPIGPEKMTFLFSLMPLPNPDGPLIFSLPPLRMSSNHPGFRFVQPIRICFWITHSPITSIVVLVFASEKDVPRNPLDNNSIKKLIQFFLSLMLFYLIYLAILTCFILIIFSLQLLQAPFFRNLAHSERTLRLLFHRGPKRKERNRMFKKKRLITGEGCLENKQITLTKLTREENVINGSAGYHKQVFSKALLRVFSSSKLKCCYPWQ